MRLVYPTGGESTKEQLSFCASHFTINSPYKGLSVDPEISAPDLICRPETWIRNQFLDKFLLPSMRRG